MSLTPLSGIPGNQGTLPKVSRDRARVAFAPAAPAPAPVQPMRVEQQELTADTARALSVETINLLVKENPELVARLIVDSGKRRRAELPMSRSELRPAALAVILCGMKRRAEPLSAADESFLADYLSETDAS